MRTLPHEPGRRHDCPMRSPRWRRATFREIQDSIGGTPELESPYFLEVLTLEESLRSADGIKLLDVSTGVRCT